MSLGEFSELVSVVKNQSPVTTTEVKEIVERYFSTVTWSPLKDEWQKLTEQQRDGLYTRLLLESVESITTRMKRLNLDDIKPTDDSNG